MESENFHIHESGETVDIGMHGKDFEKDFGKFLLFRLICQRENFQNFRFTREKKGTGKFDDFVFVYDCDDGKTKYSLIQLKHLNDENKKINFEDLKANSKSYFGLPYYFDYYTKSLSCLSSDKDLKDAELEGLIFCTNAGIEDSLGCISKTEILNEGLFRNSGKLYKLSINDEERQEIFHEQFLSERKRLANELASFVMQNKVIHLESMIKDDSFSLILKFSEMLLEHVFDVKKNKFNISFLDPQLKNINEELDNFRNEFFESLFDYQESFPHVKKIPADKKDTEGFIEFLREKTINIKIPKNSECKSLKILSEELVLSVMLEKPFDIKANIHDQKILQKLNKFIRENVIDLGSKKLKETFLSENSKSNKDVHNFRQCFFKDLKVFCNAFKDKNIKEIEEFVKVYNSHSTQEGENEVIEFLKQKEIRFAEFPEAAVDIFPSGEVDTTEIDKNILEFLNLITFAVNQKNFDNLISNEMNKLIMNKKHQILLYKSFHNFMDNWYNNGALSFSLFGSTLKLRKWLTEEDFLTSVENLQILFQGKEVKISDICPGRQIIKPEFFIYNFTTNAKLILGKRVDKDSACPFYIHRTLTQREKKVNIISLIKFFNSLVERKSEDIIIVTIHEEFDLEDFEKLHSLPVKLKDLQLFDNKHNYYFTRENFESEFFMEFYDNNKEVISRRTAHWITFLGKEFKYESSLTYHNNFFNQLGLNNRFCSDSNLKKEFICEKSFTCFEIFETEKFVIVTGDPGSGKSVLLKNFSFEVKNLNEGRFLWVILVDLNKYQKYLNKYDNFNNIRNIINFLADIENCESDFSRNALWFFLNNNRLILLFDGFDEIHENSKQEKILELLKFLKTESLTKQIWITGRPHCVHQIENVLECLSFEIKDINEDEQIKLVTNEWKTYADNSQVNLTEENASNFVKVFNKATTRDERELLGVPLFTYMFSHAYIIEAGKSSQVFPQNVSVIRLYDNFILNKFNIYFTKKVKTENIMRNDSKRLYEEMYKKIAVMNSRVIYLRPFTLVSEIMKDPLTKENIKILKRIGLIKESNGVCTFLHETFAEYFIADFLLSIIEKCMDERILNSKQVLQSVVDFLLEKKKK